MRILHVVPTYLPARRYGGPIVSVHGLCRALVAVGHDVLVATTSVDGSGDSPVPHDETVVLDTVKVRYFRSRVFRRLYYAPQMSAFFKRELDGFDCVHLHSVFLWPTNRAARICGRRGIPYVISPRGMLVEALIAQRNPMIKKTWIRWIERRTLARAAAIHVTSPIEQRELEHIGLDLAPVVTIPNGVERSTTFAPGPVSESDYILYLGRISWKKQLDKLIVALARLPGLRLVIAGSDDERLMSGLIGLAQEHGVANRVKYLGSVADEKWDLYRGALAFVLPSLSENFANVVLEACAVGCPVVISPEVGLAPLVEKYRSGIVCSVGVDQLAAAIRSIQQDPGARRRFAEGALQLAAALRWEALVAAYEGLYRGASSGKKSGQLQVRVGECGGIDGS